MQRGTSEGLVGTPSADPPRAEPMSGNGQRNAVLMANAARWCDAVLADAGSEAGRAAARRHGVAFVSIEQLTRAIAGYVARGEGCA